MITLITKSSVGVDCEKTRFPSSGKRAGKILARDSEDTQHEGSAEDFIHLLGTSLASRDNRVTPVCVCFSRLFVSRRCQRLLVVWLRGLLGPLVFLSFNSVPILLNLIFCAFFYYPLYPLRLFQAANTLF